MSVFHRREQQPDEASERSAQGFLSSLRKGQFGFRIDEVMSGQHRFEPGCGPEGYHPFEFAVTWGPSRLLDWLDPRSERFMWQEMEGVVTMGGLCRETPCHGILELRYFDEHRIRYTFDFEADARSYRYVGEKVNIRPWNLPVSHTTCFGHVTDIQTGQLISTSLTFFKLHTAPRFLASLRLWRE